MSVFVKSFEKERCDSARGVGGVMDSKIYIVRTQEMMW